MFNLGGAEVLVILLLALIVLGPQRLPDAARQVGKFMGELRKLSSGFQNEVRNAFEAADDDRRSTADLRPVSDPAPEADEVEIVPLDEDEPVYDDEYDEDLYTYYDKSAPDADVSDPDHPAPAPDVVPKSGGAGARAKLEKVPDPEPSDSVSKRRRSTASSPAKAAKPRKSAPATKKTAAASAKPTANRDRDESGTKSRSGSSGATSSAAKRPGIQRSGRAAASAKGPTTPAKGTLIPKPGQLPERRVPTEPPGEPVASRDPKPDATPDNDESIGGSKPKPS